MPFYASFKLLRPYYAVYIKISFLLIFTISTLSNVYGQTPRRFVTYSVKDGLSQSSVHAIHADVNGQIWIGTQDGLNSFDGKSFQTYRCIDNDETTISDQFVLKIAEEPGGNLWIGTRNGLNYFDKKTAKFKRYYINKNERDEFQSDYSDFFILNKDSIIIEKLGLYVLNVRKEKFTKIKNPENEPGRWIVGNDYKAWFINSAGKGFRFSDWRSGKVTGPTISLPDLKYFDFKYCLKGNSLFIYNLPEKNIFYEYNLIDFSLKQKLTLPTTVNSVECLKKGGVNISTASGILFTDNGGRSEWIQGSGKESYFPLGSVLTSHTDSRGNTWVGMAGSGLTFTNKNFNNFRLINSPLKSDRIISISGNYENIYASSHSGLYKINRSSLLAGKEKFENLISGKSIVAVTTDKYKNVWAACNSSKIYFISPVGKVLQKYDLSKNDVTHILNLYSSLNGDVFICTTNGLFIIPDRSDSLVKFHSKSKEPLVGNYIMSLFEDHENNFWVSTNNGINVLNPAFDIINTYESKGTKGSFLKRTIITCVTQDMDKNYWIGTIRNGLYRLKDNKYEHYSHLNGLSGDVINNITCDSLNRLWVVTSSGLNLFNRKENSFNNFSEFDGVPDAGFSFSAVFNSGDEIFYGTNQGILLCSAKNVSLNATLIKAIVSDVKINGKSVDISNNTIELVPDEKLIFFQAAFSPALVSGNIICQYKMQGLSDSWITLPTGVTTITYNGLPYSKLNFQIRAASSVNKLGEAEIFSILINSKAPFYKTYWFAGLMILLIGLSIYFFLSVKNKRRFKLQLRGLEVERKIQKERIRIGRDLHDNIGAYTSALIAGLNRVNTNDVKEQEKISDLKDYGSGIMLFLRETIWMLNAENLSVTAFADRFKNYVLRIAPNYSNIDFKFKEDITDEKKLSPTIMLNLFRILQEAVQNSCKHSGATAIVICIVSSESLSFIVEDNGLGFFENSDKEHYGLDNMKHRAMEIGFELKISSGSNGTIVSVSENTANASL